MSSETKMPTKFITPLRWGTPNPDWATLPLFDRTGWKRVRFGDVVENLNETCDPAEAGLERFIAMEHLEPGSLHVRSWGNVSDGTTFTRRCRPGQVLFGKRRAYQRKVAVAEFEAVVSGDIYVLAPKDTQCLLPELLPFLCLSERFFQHAVGTSAGSLSPRTNWSSLASFEFDLPPLDQQRRIAEILWAVDDTEQQELNLRDSFTAVVGARLSEVFADDRGTAPFKRVEEIAAPEKNAIVDGPFGTNLKSIHYRTSGVPVIQSQFVTSGVFRAENYVYVTPEHFKSEVRSKTVPGDIIMAKIGENCGTCAILPEGHPTSIIAGNVLKITTNPATCLNRFLLYYFKHEYSVNRLIKVKNTTAQPAISLQQLKRLKFRLPSIHNQRRMLDDVEALESAGMAAAASSKALSTLKTELINSIA
jgi:type I restriction enzyme, S subunit